LRYTKTDRPFCDILDTVIEQLKDVTPFHSLQTLVKDCKEEGYFNPDVLIMKILSIIHNHFKKGGKKSRKNRPRVSVSKRKRYK
jgi:hypothetical protein